MSNPINQFPEILQVEELSAGYFFQGQTNQILNALSFSLSAGETLGITGESGAGKSFLARCILRLIPKNLAEINGGKVNFQSKHFGPIDLLREKENRLNQIRGNEISLLFQETNAALNPSIRIGKQIARTIAVHSGKSKKESMIESIGLLERLNFDNPDQVAKKYPYQLSGGMAQRVNVANAIANKPRVIISDECTSSLDEENQEIIIDSLKEACKQQESGLIFISHDLHLVNKISDRTLGLNDGKLSELNLEDITASKKSIDPFRGWKKDGNGHEPWLEIRSLNMDFSEPSLFSVRDRKEHALQSVSFQVPEGLSLGIFGKSGAGKSTLGKILLGLVEPSKGQVLLNKKPIDHKSPGFRKRNQIVFQELTLSMNPYKTIGFHLAEPLHIHRIGSKAEKVKKVYEILSLMNLDREIADRYPHQLSVGQRQRVLIGRSLILEPEMLVLDEALSSLDQKNKMEILELLKELKETRKLRYVLISHEKDLLSELCEQVIELEDGKIIQDIFKP